MGLWHGLAGCDGALARAALAVLRLPQGQRLVPAPLRTRAAGEGALAPPLASSIQSQVLSLASPHGAGVSSLSIGQFEEGGGKWARHAVGRHGAPLAALRSAVERAEQRGRIQEYLGGPSAEPRVKDQMNPPLQPLPRPGQVDRNKKDVGRPVPKGAPRDGKLGAKPTQHTGHAAQQKPSAASQRAAGLHPEQPRKGTKHPVVPGVSRSVQPRGKLPASSHLNPGRSKNPAQDTAAPPAGSEQPPPGAPCCPNGDLQDRLGSDKENIQAQAPAQPVLNRALQAAGDRRVLTPRQSSAITSRAITGPRDRVSSHQAKEKLAPEKFRQTVSASKNPSTKTQPLQPPWLPAASAHFLHKKSGANQEKTGTARPLHMKRSPTKPLTSSRPQGTTQLPSSLKLDGTVRQQKPLAKGEADRKEVKVAPPGHAAVSRAPRKQPCSTQSSRAPPVESDWRRDRVNPELPKAGGMFPRRVPKTLMSADRKKQLQEWLASKGKTYKRPPMILLQKNPVKLSCRNIKEKEKQEKPELPSLEKTNSLLTECLKLVEEGAQAEEVLATLSAIPQAERFAKFWICRAKLQARSGPFDVAGLYRAAVCAGATPLQELREVVLDMLKAANRTSEGEKAELPIPWDPATPGPGGRQPRAVTPCPPGRSLTCLPVSVKLQVTSAPRGRELPEGPELKFLTPVRRSLRIERAGRRYPEMLKDHDPVVSSLREILDPEEETRFFFRRNEALPEVVEPEGIGLCPPECC